MSILKKIFGGSKEAPKQIQGIEPEVSVMDQASDEQRIIDEIHNEFDTAPARILEQAMEILNNERGAKVELESTIVDKAKRLREQGFIKNGLVANLHKTESLIVEKDRIIGMNHQMAEGVKYYSSKYPFLKFLPVSELDRICDKYGLVYAPVKHYKMPVPDKNLKDIEDSQRLDEKDAPGKHIIYRLTDPYNQVNGLTREEEYELREVGIPVNPNVKENTYRLGGTSKYNQKDIIEMYFGKKVTMSWSWAGGHEFTETDRSGLFIAAPEKHFDLDGLTFDNKKGYFQVTKTIVVKDPIVFRYVKGGIQVLTKWGLEAEDPALQIEILN
jgi:hypothetical protein